MSEQSENSAHPIDAPPASPQPARPAPADEVRSRLHRIALELIRSRNRALLVEFLTLRRTVA